MVLFNWQTKDIIHPVIETDSNRMLEQGIKRDDGFSRLMAAVVNDTAVMYNTYSGNGFGSDSNTVSTQTAKLKGQSSASGLNSPRNQRPATGQLSAAQKTVPNVVSADPASLVAPGSEKQYKSPTNVNQQPVILNRDSLLTTNRQEMRARDSLNTSRKKAVRDSLIYTNKQQALIRDSLNSARKAVIKDSIATVKRRQAFVKDSLLTVRKAGRENPQASGKMEGSGAESLAAKRLQQSTDSLQSASKEKAQKDSLIAVQRAGFIKDSLELASRSTTGSHHSSLTQIKKLREVSLKVSRKMVFLDIGKDGRADTITLFVYFESTDSIIKKRPEKEPVALKKALPPDSTDTSESNKAPVKKNASKAGDAIVCSQAATESDTEALRSAILKANSEQEKIAVAAGAFAMKCYSVSQVRFLASLLVSDKAKFGLMDAARMHILDRDHFPELVDMLTDKNFQRKFLVMAEKRS